MFSIVNFFFEKQPSLRKIMQNENNLPTNAAKEISLQHPLPPSLTGKPTAPPTH